MVRAENEMISPPIDTGRDMRRSRMVGSIPAKKQKCLRRRCGLAV